MHSEWGILPIVKRVVRKTGTDFYLTSGGTWETDCFLAQDFANADSALSTVLGLGLKKVELVIVIDEVPSDRYDIALPLFPGH